MPNKQDSKNIFHALQGTFLTTCFSLYCAAECTGLFLLFTYRRLQSTSPQALLLFQRWPLLEFLCFWQLGGMPALSCAADDPSNDPDLETGCMPGAASCVACWSAPCTADTAGTWGYMTRRSATRSLPERNLTLYSGPSADTCHRRLASKKKKTKKNTLRRRITGSAKLSRVCRSQITSPLIKEYF